MCHEFHTCNEPWFYHPKLEATRRYNFNNIKQAELNSLIENSQASLCNRHMTRFLQSLSTYWSTRLYHISLYLSCIGNDIDTHIHWIIELNIVTLHARGRMLSKSGKRNARLTATHAVGRRGPSKINLIWAPTAKKRNLRSFMMKVLCFPLRNFWNPKALILWRLEVKQNNAVSLKRTFNP